MNEEYKLLAGAGASGLAVGLGIGIAATLFIVKKKLERKYADISSREIAEAKQFYSLLNKKDSYSTPESAAESLNLTEAVDALRSYQGNGVTIEETVTLVEEFVSSEPVADPEYSEEDFNYDEELKSRGTNYPYVITKQEFFDNDSDYKQTQYTYFAGDQVVTDSEDEPLEDVDDIVGDDNLLRFGHGSGDAKVVYLRNEKMQMEIELVSNKNKYIEEILGEIKHSSDRHSKKVRKFRNERE